METEPETPVCPEPMNVWDDRYLIEFLDGIDLAHWRGPDGALATLDGATGVDLTPLRKIAGWNFDVEDYVEMVGEEEAERIWRHETAQNAASWQDPQALIDCLRALIAAWDANPTIWIAVTDVRDKDYYAQGIARQDLSGLLRHGEWAAAHGAQRLRLVVG